MYYISGDGQEPVYIQSLSPTLPGADVQVSGLLGHLLTCTDSCQPPCAAASDTKAAAWGGWRDMQEAGPHTH